tara:strand:- start:217 stop:444 length:228 start_codon:yes stop_codon:yes gene_type:complete
MNITELNQKWNQLNALCNNLWDRSKSLQEQSDAYGKAWKARFDIGQEIAKVATPAPKSPNRMRDWQLKFESQKDC